MNRGALRIVMASMVLMPPACSPSPTPVEEEVLVLEVAPDRVACAGEGSGQCLQVRSPGETEWQTFYDTIEGFEHQEGTRYTLEVGRRRVRNPLADGSAYAYRLIRIISATIVLEPVGG